MEYIVAALVAIVSIVSTIVVLAIVKISRHESKLEEVSKMNEARDEVIHQLIHNQQQQESLNNILAQAISELQDERREESKGLFRQKIGEA